MYELKGKKLILEEIKSDTKDNIHFDFMVDERFDNIEFAVEFAEMIRQTLKVETLSIKEVRGKHIIFYSVLVEDLKEFYMALDGRLA